ncbi:FAD-dependent oxidoreductase [Pseudomonas aeruginosa]|nr:FAD-dependent oxidoreductase [Pseudomonas aeruginosa]
MSQRKIAIVGGGLAGLYAAYRLQSAGIDFDLFEARKRLGGRILSTAKGGLDLGPTWFWPDFQPRMRELLAELGLPAFEQHEQGDALFDRGPGQVMCRQGYQSGNLSMRIAGGSARLVQALAAALPAERLHLETELLAARLTNDGVQLQLSSDRRAQPVYDALWLAIPPRLAGRVDYNPPLSPPAIQQLSAVPTWMAAPAKYMARYMRPFWRQQGLSGDAFSAIGPLGEIHDAGHDEAAALFGFFAIGAQQRRALNESDLKALCRAQLTRLFGEAAGNPVEDWVQDWSAEAFTATHDDLTPPRWHSVYEVSHSIDGPWRKRLKLIGSEAGGEQGGYMEGALLAVDAALQLLT